MQHRIFEWVPSGSCISSIQLSHDKHRRLKSSLFAKLAHEIPSTSLDRVLGLMNGLFISSPPAAMFFKSPFLRSIRSRLDYFVRFKLELGGEEVFGTTAARNIFDVASNKAGATLDDFKLLSQLCFYWGGNLRTEVNTAIPQFMAAELPASSPSGSNAPAMGRLVAEPPPTKRSKTFLASAAESLGQFYLFSTTYCGCGLDRYDFRVVHMIVALLGLVCLCIRGLGCIFWDGFDYGH